MSRSRNLALSCTLALAASAFAPDAEAALVERILYFNASAHCQAALPMYDGMIRKRPLAVVNEGAGTSFVTCAIPTQGRIVSLELFASARGGVPAQLTCTAVSGLESEVSHRVPRTINLPASGARAGTLWWGTYYGGPLARPTGEPNFFVGPYLAVTCALPPATGLNNFILTYNEEIGA
ncbi:hypothetical protein [Luteimonas arsenica]|uniref:hypothetical protein n=1 Tax=Luteimonas arsenica TaxID=1586242 RepID=UPI0010549D38|nr:hypothetical protein [Luteimonas arsenica]